MTRPPIAGGGAIAGGSGEPDKLFMGEEWRTCCRRMHIVPGARCILAADLAKLALETAYFVAHIGYVDAVCCMQLSWALLGSAMAIPALVSNGECRHNYLWPLLVLKAIECLACLFVLLLIFILGVSGPLGYKALRWLIAWKYRRIEDKDAVMFSLVTFLVVSILLVVNVYVLHMLFTLRNYLRLKALSLYLDHRNRVIRNIILH